MYSALPETNDQPITLLLKGAPGTGKTWKAAHFPAPVLFNFDQNLSGLRKLPAELRSKIRLMEPRVNDKGKQVSDIMVFDNFVKQIEAVAADESVGTIVIDSLTTMAECLIDKIVGTSSPSSKVQIQHYGDFTRYLKWLAETILCATDLDKNIIFIAHERLVKDELTQQVVFTLNIVSNMRDNFDLYFSDCWRCYAKVGTKGVQYRVRVLPGSNFNAKCSLTLPDDFLWDEEKDNILRQISPKPNNTKQ